MNWNTIDSHRLVRAFLAANNADQIRNFLNDIMTENELDQMVKRLKAVHMINIGTPYRYVSSEIGLSSATIARLSKKLADKKGGFHEIMKKLRPDEVH